MLTLERFEHELVKLKSKFPADHVGSVFAGRCGNHCIVHQIAHDMTGAAGCSGADGIAWGDWGSPHHPFYAFETEPKLLWAVQAAIVMNNMGVAWHDIIDTLVPQTSDAWKQLQQEVSLVEA